MTRYIYIYIIFCSPQEGICQILFPLITDTGIYIPHEAIQNPQYA